MQGLKERVVLVTGASRGVGKGIALELIEAGATVYITGRSVADMRYLAGKGTAIECDHRNDEQAQAAFHQIADEQGRLDILINNVWGGYDNMLENGEFTWSRPFWQQPLWRWDAMFQAGVRAHYVASQFARPALLFNVLTMRVLLPARRYDDDPKRINFFTQAIAQMQALPGVEAAGAINFMPFAGPGAGTGFEIAGKPPSCQDRCR